MNWIHRILREEHRLGLRVIKTGVAVTVCVVISTLIGLDHAFIAVIATVMSMGKSIDMSVKSGKDKMLGVVIATAVGWAFSSLSPANAGLCGIGVILVLYLCHLLRLQNAGALASVVFAAMMFGVSSSDPLKNSLYCGGDALLGIAVAVVINLLVMPPNYSEEIKRSFSELRERTLLALEDAGEKREIDIRSIEGAIEQLSRNVRLYVSEAKILRWNDDEVFSISCKLTVYRMIFDELKAVEVLDFTDLSGETPDPELLTVYRYHITRMRQLYESTQENAPTAQKVK